MTTTKTYSWRSCPRRRRICYDRVNGSTPKATKKFFGAAVFQKCCRVIPRSAGDFPLRGKMSVKLTKGSGKNVGVADKGEGHPLKTRGEQPLIFCEAKTKANAFQQENEIRNYVPSIAPLKYTDRIYSKAAYGAMDDNPGKSRDLPFCRRR